MGVRLARRDDLTAIAEIYDREVLQSAATMDTVVRTAAEYLAWLDAHPADRYPVIVLEGPGGVVLGWASLTAFSPRLGYARCAEVSVYVHHSTRRAGCGRTLLSALIDEAQRVGIRHLLARIESTGAASLRLHEGLGFELAGTLHRVAEKFGRVLDVVLLEKVLDGPTAP